MPIRPWALDADRRLAIGALGVLVDDVLGYALNEARPAGWSVTTEIGLEVLGPPPTTGRVHGRARLSAADERGAVTHGELLDDTGRVFASGTERGRFVPDEPTEPTSATDDEDATPADLLAALGGAIRDGDALRLVVGGAVANPRGNLHGGVALGLAETCAALAVPVPSSTTGVRVHYLRPVPPGTRLTVTPRVVHRGRSLAVVDVEGVRDDGRLAFRATITRE